MRKYDLDERLFGVWKIEKSNVELRQFYLDLSCEYNEMWVTYSICVKWIELGSIIDLFTCTLIFFMVCLVCLEWCKVLQMKIAKIDIIISTAAMMKLYTVMALLIIEMHFTVIQLKRWNANHNSLEANILFNIHQKGVSNFLHRIWLAARKLTKAKSLTSHTIPMIRQNVKQSRIATCLPRGVQLIHRIIVAILSNSITVEYAWNSRSFQLTQRRVFIKLKCKLPQRTKHKFTNTHNE